MRDYSKYILDYEEAMRKRIPGRQRVLRFLNFVQTKNVPVSEWINTFYEYQDLFLDKLSPKSKIVYRNNIIRFIEYTIDHFHGKQQSVIHAYNKSGYIIRKDDRIVKNKTEKPKIGILKINKLEEKKKITHYEHNTTRRKHTKIISDWRKL